MNNSDDESAAGRPPLADSTVSRRSGPTLDAASGPTAATVPSAPRPLPDTSRRVLVMGIVNRTRDSFFDEGRTWALDAAVAAGLEAAEDGADLIDVGGVKFAPGEALPVEEEIERVTPVLEALRRELPGHVRLSVDTFHAPVARAALEVGADLINDTTGLSDPQMAATVAETVPRWSSPTRSRSRAAPTPTRATRTWSRRCARSSPTGWTAPSRPASRARGSCWTRART